eukprot:COSAG02_NODE_5427_length_4339_cov_2.935377_7_plen_41_part_01
MRSLRLGKVFLGVRHWRTPRENRQSVLYWVSLDTPQHAMLV